MELLIIIYSTIIVVLICMVGKRTDKIIELLQQTNKEEAK